MEHSAKYDRVKGWYDTGLWSKRRVYDAVGKGWITAAEYAEITEEAYAG